MAPVSKGCLLLHIFHNSLLWAYIVLALLEVLAINQRVFFFSVVELSGTHLATQSMGSWGLDSNGHSGPYPHSAALESVD